MAWDWDKVSVLTREYVLKGLEDQLASTNFLFSRLYRKNLVRKAGGKEIVKKVVLGENPNVGSYSRYDLLAAEDAQVFGEATWQWKNYYVTIIIAGTDIAKNDGDEKFFSLVEEETTNAKNSLIRSIAADIYADGTGNGGKELDGLAVAVDDGTNYSTYAEIDRTTYTAWQANYFGAGSDRDPSFALLNRSLSSTITNNGMANFGVTTVSVADKIQEELIAENQRFLSDENEAALGYENILFKRRPIYVDENCPAKTLFWLNDQYMNLIVNKNFDFEFTGFRPVSRQHAVEAQIYWHGNLIITRPGATAKVTALSESYS